MFQYLPALQAGGVSGHVIPLFSNDYLQHRYKTGRGQAKDVALAFLHRLRALIGVRDFDLAIIEYELLPYFPAVLEPLLGRMGVPYVADYDDALFHQYDEHSNPWVRGLLGGKIAHVMRGAQLVTVGNSYLADYARRVGARRVEIVPTVVDLERYSRGQEVGSGVRPFTIGWIGSPATTKYLRSIAPALRAVVNQHGVRVHLVGSGPIAVEGIDAEVLPWAEETEFADIRRFDVGIMPLPDEPWARGKCGLKLIQYMACGLPVVASPVGANREIVEHGVNGFLAETQEEWVQALSLLMSDSSLRRRMGDAGRSKVEAHYSLQKTGPRFCFLLKSVVEGA